MSALSVHSQSYHIKYHDTRHYVFIKSPMLMYLRNPALSWLFSGLIEGGRR